MSQRMSLVPGLITVMLALVIGRLLVTHEVVRYVGPLVIPLLIVSVPILLAVGSWQLIDVVAKRTVHQHTRPLVAIMLLPLVAMAGLGPRPLGLYTSQRSAGQRAATTGASSPGQGSPSTWTTPDPVRVDPATGRTLGGYADGQQNPPDEHGSTRARPIGPQPDHFDALHGDPAAVGLYDYVVRSTEGGTKTLVGRRLQIEGFVSRDPDRPDGPWVLTRLKMWCCAADAIPFMVTAQGAPVEQPGTWVRVTGHYLAPTGDGDARLAVDQVEQVPEPTDPYVW